MSILQVRELATLEEQSSVLTDLGESVKIVAADVRSLQQDSVSE